jgi:hypothetical protein
VSNAYRSEQLLRRLGVLPADLSLGVADPRWPVAHEKLRLVEDALDEAEERGAADERAKGKR